MLTNLKTLTLLMLLAGVSLGVFATTLIAAGSPDPAPAPYDERVEAYRRAYGLDQDQTNAVRTELIRHRKHMYDLLIELRHKNEQRFKEIVDGTESRIREIIEDRNPTDSNR
jgi:hypothetical protein